MPLALALLFVVVSWWLHRCSKMWLTFGLTLVAVVFTGVGYSALRQPEQRADHYIHVINLKDPAPQWMEVELVEPTQRGRHSMKAVAQVRAVADSAGWQVTQGLIQLFLASDSLSLQRGDQLLVRAHPQVPSGADNPHQFDYRRYLQYRGILAQCYLSESSYRVVGHNRRGLCAWADQTRNQLLQTVQSSRLTSSQQGVAQALVLGWKEEIDPETQQRYRDAGITHLLCVSGLHVGIVASLIGYLFFFLGRSRRGKAMRGAIQLAGIWLFVLLTGMAPATLRAGIMFSFIVIGQMSFARPPTANATAASALLLLLVRPSLLFDVGFQLSYAAVAGILAMHRPLTALIPFSEPIDVKSQPRWLRAIRWLVQKVWSLTCLTTAAQLATLPFTLYYFHQFPLYFLIANLLVVPFAGLLLGSLLLMMLVSGWQWAFGLVGGFVSLQLSGIDALLRWISHLPHALLDQLYFDLPMALMLAASILLLVAYLRRSDRRLLLAVAAVLLLLTSHDVATQLQSRRQCQLVVYSAGRHQAVEFIVGRQSLLLADSDVVEQPERISYQRQGNLTAHRVRHSYCYPLSTTSSLQLGDACYYDHAFLLGNCRMVWVDRSRAWQLTNLLRRGDTATLPRMSTPVNYLLLMGYPTIDIPQLQQFYHFDTLVIASSNSQRQQERWKRQCDSLQLPVQFGAFVVAIR